MIQLYYDIVNHPPYVKSVEVRQGTDLRYSGTWKDKEETSGRGMMKWYRTTKTLVGRTLEKDPNHPDKDLEPGTIVFKINFSEPVNQDDVKVMLGDRPIKGFLQGNHDVWIGQYQIPADGSFKGKKTISIQAKDENNHYNDEGGILDTKPGKPARRLYSSGKLEWKDYIPGEDTYHSVVIKVEMPITTGTDENAYWLVADGSLFDLYWGTLASTENKYGKEGVLAGPFPDTQTRSEVFDYIAGQMMAHKNTVFRKLAEEFPESTTIRIELYEDGELIFPFVGATDKIEDYLNEAPTEIETYPESEVDVADPIPFPPEAGVVETSAAAAGDTIATTATTFWQKVNWPLVGVLLVFSYCTLLAVVILVIKKTRPTYIDPSEIQVIESLLVLYPGGQRMTLPMPEERLSIGRHSSNTLVLQDSHASSFHAEILVTPDGYLVKDLESTNGVFVNDRKVTEKILHTGDVIKIGQTRITPS